MELSDEKASFLSFYQSMNEARSLSLVFYQNMKEPSPWQTILLNFFGIFVFDMNPLCKMNFTMKVFKVALKSLKNRKFANRKRICKKKKSLQKENVFVKRKRIYKKKKSLQKESLCKKKTYL